MCIEYKSSDNISTFDGSLQEVQMPFRAVNGWRGPGALGIAFGHFALLFGICSIERLSPLRVLVDLFFVFSGAFMAHAYSARLRDVSALPEYVVRRFGRIWPLHAAMLLLLVLYEASKLTLLRFKPTLHLHAFASDTANPSAIWSNLLLVHSLGLHNSETWNFPSWSLSVEFVTYLVFGVFCLLPGLARRSLGFAIIAASTAILIMVAPAHMRSTFDFGVFRCFAGFFAGVLLWDFLTHVRLPRWPMPTVVEALAVIGTISWMIYSVDTYAIYAAPLVFSLLVAVYAPERGMISKILNKKPFQLGAELSFAIYLVHAPILVVLSALLRAYGIEVGQMVDAGGATLQYAASPLLLAGISIFYVVAIALTTTLGYLFIERPGRALFNGLAKRLRKSRRPASSMKCTASSTQDFAKL